MKEEPLLQKIHLLRKKIEDDHYEMLNTFGFDHEFERMDNFIADQNRSELEKAFYLILNQFPLFEKSYIIRPSEKVLIADIYDLSSPGVAYEIDFAIYGGSIENPLKVAIECDGFRSHGRKTKNRDRRKDTNLQAAGWIVMRFESTEIHKEVKALLDSEGYSSSFLTSIENVIQEKLKIIDNHSYSLRAYRQKLTGFKIGNSKCSNCGHVNEVKLNYKTAVCRSCQQKFRIEVSKEEILYEHNGLIFFKDK